VRGAMDLTEEKEGGQTTGSQCGDGEGRSMWSFGGLVPRGRVLGSEIANSDGKMNGWLYLASA